MEYTVKKGDTLYGIAKMYDTTVDDLVRDNNIADRNLIQVGDVLNVGNTKTATTAVSDSVDTAEKRFENWFKAKPSEYKSKYKTEIESLKRELANREFSYSPENDSIYNGYRDMITSEAKLALADAAGLASELNGGYSTSYAVQAGLSAFNDKMKELDDVIPELYKAAYDKYEDETAMLKSRLDTVINLENDEWEKYTDILDSYYEEGDMLFDQFHKLSNEEFDRFYSMYKLSL